MLTLHPSACEWPRNDDSPSAIADDSERPITDSSGSEPVRSLFLIIKPFTLEQVSQGLNSGMPAGVGGASQSGPILPKLKQNMRMIWFLFGSRKKNNVIVLQHLPPIVVHG